MIFHYQKFEEVGETNFKYNLNINGYIVLLEEVEFIEFAVSCLRAYEEIKNLIHSNKFLLKSSELIPFTVIDKAIPIGFRILLAGNMVSLNLRGQKIFEIHFDNFEIFSGQLYDILNAEYTGNIFDLRTLDAIYLEHMLGADLPFFTGWNYDEEYISDLKVFDKQTLSEVSIEHHLDFLQLKSKKFFNSPRLTTNILGESNEFRFRKILSSLIQKGYPCDDKFIILYNDEMTVRDGTRRLSCLYFLHGNIKIPVLRLRFSKNYYSYSMFRKKIWKV